MQYKEELKLKRLAFTTLGALALLTFLICLMGIVESI